MGWDLRSRDDLEALFALYEDRSPTSPRRLAIIDRINGGFVGTFGFHSFSEGQRCAEIAYDLAPEYWGRGIATALCTRLANWAYGAYDLTRVQATVLVTNERSERVLKSSGFEYEGFLHAYRMVRGKPGDFKMYRHLRND